MAAEDLFKRYLEVGASVLGMSRERAEVIVRDLVASGEVAKGQATKAADWLVERGRAGTEELTDMIRREIRQQVAAMGLATLEDIARLEAKLEQATAAAPATGVTASASARPKKKAAAGPPAAGAKEAKAAPADGPPSGRRGAGITRSGSVAGKSVPPGAAPPAGEDIPPEG